jgi:hypothetical protein
MIKYTLLLTVLVFISVVGKGQEENKRRSDSLDVLSRMWYHKSRVYVDSCAMYPEKKNAYLREAMSCINKSDYYAKWSEEVHLDYLKDLIVLVRFKMDMETLSLKNADSSFYKQLDSQYTEDHKQWIAHLKLQP